MCILALDLGTTAFKCAPVSEERLLAPPATARYALDYRDGQVTFDPEAYFRIAMQALGRASAAARAAGEPVSAIGVSSQAQTYIPLDAAGRPLHPAVVWTDVRAGAEADEVARAIPDFARHSGFRRPQAELFLPKVMHFVRHAGIPLRRVWKFLLLNEYILYRLTGRAYGDETNQGMSGFYDIAERRVSQAALDLAGLNAGQLAQIAPAAGIGHTLDSARAAELGLEPVPLYSCGNDQSAAAAGAGLSAEGDVLCNFGTAMVVYALQDELPAALRDRQIAGINPLTGRYFVLGSEPECGNVLDWARAMFYRDRAFESMLAEALGGEVDPSRLPAVEWRGGGTLDLARLSLASEPKHVVRALLERYAGIFGELLEGMTVPSRAMRLFASGGLSRSEAWLEFLERRHAIAFTRAGADQPGLAGIARIIRAAQAQAGRRASGPSEG